ncbi:hypothetical protein HN803_07200 [candidate division WWE3 bacterium]|nr:hypothetical protein [candidate division WWE3 bacterium]
MSLETDIKKEKVPFTQIANEVLNSKLLTFKAKGIYAFMMSKPNGWNFTIRSMAKQVKDGEDGIRSGLRELREQGAIVYVKHQNGTGTYHLKAVINSSKKPQREKPVKALQHHNGEIPRRENPLKGKSTRISNKEPVVIKKQDSNKDIHTQKSQIEIIGEFVPNDSSANRLREKHPNISQRQAQTLIEDFKDKMTERTLTPKSRPWADIQSQFRSYVTNEYVKPMTVSTTSETSALTYHDIGKIIKAEKEKRAQGVESAGNIIGQLADNMRRG